MAIPHTSQSTGGIFRFDDGRDVPDTLSTLFTYRDFPVYMRVTQASSTPREIRIMGTHTIEDATFGHNAALACHMANHSYFNETIATWDGDANEIRG